MHVVALTCVPTGMNTGVSTSPCRNDIQPTRAFVVEHSAITLYVNGGDDIFLLIPDKPRTANDIVFDVRCRLRAHGYVHVFGVVTVVWFDRAPDDCQRHLSERSE